MERYAMNHYQVYFAKRESTKYELRGERKSEEQKLDRLKKLLQMKVQSASGGIAAIRAA